MAVTPQGRRQQADFSTFPQQQSLSPNFWTKLKEAIMDYANWMKLNTKMHDKELRYICLPMTHDSGTLRPDQ